MLLASFTYFHEVEAIETTGRTPNALHGAESPALLSRRNLIRRIGGSALALGAGLGLPEMGRAAESRENYRATNGRIKQSVIYWCFKPMAVQDLAVNAAKMGMKSVELVGPEFWPALKELGLVCALAPSHGFAKGFAHREEHEECLKVLLAKNR